MKGIIKNSVLLLAALSLGSCNDWLDVNEDPNNPTNVAPEFVLPAAQASVVGAVGGDLAIIGGIWSQHWTQSNASSQYRNIDAYDLNPSDYNGLWTELYAGGLNDFEDIKNKATASGNNNMVLQAVAVQTYGFQLLADFFDKIPLTEALQVETNKSPKYDDGPAVYAELLKRLDAALALDFNNGKSTAVSSDLIYGGLSADDQIDQWKRFVNTLKLKMYLRQTASPNATQAVAAIKAMLDANTPFLEDDAALTKFVDEPNRSNPLYETNVRQLNTSTNLRLSRTLQTYLQANGDDARLAAYFTPGATGQYGLEQGDYDNASVAPGTPSVAKMSPTDPFYFFSIDEVYFLLSEAYLRIGNDAKAKEFYEKAVPAAYAKFNIAFDAKKIAKGGVYEYPATGGLEAKLKAIMYQKWVAMFRQGYESFLDQARTGYPEKSPVRSTANNYVPGQWTVSIEAVTNNALPKRIPYVAASRDVNVNTPPSVPITQKVWWMK
ncbi:SusD/RagB family nutrient-binding outer membrane lipoprotein [Dyadobacter sp. 676]|uniref:SusD/RagB family nutrient-binding outer membrane lipoprotein n=1 Tax=Dyadobacter sp. 676 TaxID=3088362 RepID=A0AAU8FGA0_9BACT